MFVDELGADDPIRGDPVKQQVRQEVADPYHCWSPASISVHHEKEGRRMVDSMVRARIMEEVSWSTDWRSKAFFMEKAMHERKLRMVTYFHLLNTHSRGPCGPSSLQRRSGGLCIVRIGCL